MKSINIPHKTIILLTFILLSVCSTVKAQLDLNSGGSVGIGTGSPGYKLHVTGADAAFDTPGDMRLYLNHNTSGNVGSIIFTTGGPGTSNGWAEIGLTGDNNLHLKANPSAGSYTDRITILGSNGNVGIGTTSPSYRLDVSGGDINIASSGNAYRFQGNKILWYNSTTTSNIFAGVNAGAAITTGIDNTFAGYYAGNATTTGSDNTAFGFNALKSGASTFDNTAIGASALYSLSSNANFNTACGNGTLGSTSTGSGNTGSGYYNLFNNTTGSYNTSSGYLALESNTTGSYNASLGYLAGYNYTAGSYNTFIGTSADANANSYTYATALGAGAIVLGSSRIQLGNTTTDVYQTSGHYYTSDGRFKTNVNENVKGLEFINKLRPVTYNMDTRKLDDFMTQHMPDSIKVKHKMGMDFTASTAVVHSGFIAQEVADAAKQCGFNSSIVHTPENSSDLYGVGYQEIVVPLVKAVQELSRTVDSLKKALSSIRNSPVNATADPSNIDKGAAIHIELNNLDIAVLNEAAPNPFAEQTTISFYIPEKSAKAQMLFYSGNGVLIKSVDIAKRGSGQIYVFANDLSSGMYTYTLVVDGKVIDTKKMIKQ